MLLTICLSAIGFFILVLCILAYVMRKYRKDESEDFTKMSDTKELIVDNKGRMFDIDNQQIHCGYETGIYPSGKK